jgi:hypothetical protein
MNQARRLKIPKICESVNLEAKQTQTPPDMILEDLEILAMPRRIHSLPLFNR